MAFGIPDVSSPLEPIAGGQLKPDLHGHFHDNRIRYVVEATEPDLRYTVHMGPSTNELLALKVMLDTLRPLTDLQIQRLWPQWSAEDALFIYAANAIEGSTTTLAETTVVLESGITIGVGPANGGRSPSTSAVRCASRQTG
jgi:hypothetical protein